MKDIKINWKLKLTSRKFWAAILGFISPLLLSFNVSESVVAQVSSIVMSGATLIAYITGEGLVDSNKQGDERNS